MNSFTVPAFRSIGGRLIPPSPSAYSPCPSPSAPETSAPPSPLRRPLHDPHIHLRRTLRRHHIRQRPARNLHPHSPSTPASKSVHPDTFSTSRAISSTAECPFSKSTPACAPTPSTRRSKVPNTLPRRLVRQPLRRLHHIHGLTLLRQPLRNRPRHPTPHLLIRSSAAASPAAPHPSPAAPATASSAITTPAFISSTPGPQSLPSASRQGIVSSASPPAKPYPDVPAASLLPRLLHAGPNRSSSTSPNAFCRCRLTRPPIPFAHSATSSPARSTPALSWLGDSTSTSSRRRPFSRPSDSPPQSCCNSAILIANPPRSFKTKTILRPHPLNRARRPVSDLPHPPPPPTPDITSPVQPHESHETVQRLPIRANHPHPP